MNNLNPNNTIGLIASGINLGKLFCGDTYYLSIEVSKNNQVKRSSRYSFNWSDSGPKTSIVSRPIFDPPAGTYNVSEFPMLVSLTSADPVLNIYYTLDGSNPNLSSNIYISPLSITAGTTINAISFTGSLFSNLSSGTYNSSYYTVSSVESSLENQINLINPIDISLSTTTQDAVIYYTIDSSSPDCSGVFTEYTSPITVLNDTTIKAIACKLNYLPSSVSTFTYTFFVPLDPVAITPPGGTYTSIQNVILSNSNAGATIRYTTTGIDPTETSPIYSGPINVSSSKTIKTIAYVGSFSSIVSQADYNITLPALDPTFSPVPGTYNNQSILLNTITPSPYTIRYTTDGTDPNETSNLYTGSGVFVSNNLTLKARVYKTGWSSSPVAEGNFNISDPAVIPLFSPNGGIHTNSVSVTLSCSTPSSTIRYTTDGSIPTRDVGNIYSSVLNLITTTTINAVCYAPGYSISPVIEKLFNINLIVSNL